MAAILTRTRKIADDDLPKILSDDDLLAWGQSLGDVHLVAWAPADVDEAPVDVLEVVDVTEPVTAAEPEPPAKVARISQRRRELVALRRHLAEEQQAALAARAAEIAGPARGRRQPLRGYRPEGPAERAGESVSRHNRLQERLSRVVPVARAGDGQWTARERERRQPLIRVRIAQADTF